MKTIKTTIAILALSIFTISCSKEESKSAELVKDCVTKNYGVITVKYLNLNFRHAIDITKVGTTVFRSKITEIGIANDTVNLKPGNYILSISRINNNGASLESHPSTNVLITQCSNQTINTQI